MDSNIVLSKEDSKRVGPNLVKAARDKNEERYGQILVEQVQQIMQHRNALQINLEKTKIEIELYDKRIAAIEAGEFTVGYSGGIQYNDPALWMR